MIPITEVVKGIYKIGPLDTKMPTEATHPFLVVGEEQSAIVEPGEEGQIDELLEAIRQIGVPLERIAYVIGTHIHLHHVQGVPMLLPRLPQAKFVVHPQGAPHVIEPTRLVESTIQVWGAHCYGPFPGVPKERVMTPADGQVLDLGNREMQILYATGHAPHHMIIFDRNTRALFSGDLVSLSPGRLRGRPDILPPLFDVDKQIQSLRRAMALNPYVLLRFGHQGFSFSPEKTLRWAEEDYLAVERICLDGMRRKLTSPQIGEKVEEYYRAIGVGSVQETGEPEILGRAPFGMLAYIKRKHPELEMPAGASARNPRTA